MRINREAASTIITRMNESFPGLRNAARQERKAIAKDVKKDPVGTAYRAAHGFYNSVNDFKYNQELIKLKEQVAKEQYSKSNPIDKASTIFA